MFNNKETIMYYIKKHDSNLKEFDYAISLNYSKELRKSNVDSAYYMTLYYKNSFNECINVLDRIVRIYDAMCLDYINNFLSFTKFTEYYNLDKKEIHYINSLLEYRGVEDA